MTLPLIAFMLCTLSAVISAYTGHRVTSACMFLLALANLFAMMDMLNGNGGRPA